MRSKNTILALVVALVLAVASYVILAFVGLSGERGEGMAVRGGFYLQEAATPVMEDLTTVYNLVTYIIAGIVAFVLGLMAYIMIRYREKANPVPSKTSHNTLIEVVWTIVPVLILLVIAVPSMQLLYFQDRIPETEVTVKAVGNTWNWEYSYPDHEDVDSFVSNPLDKTQSTDAGKPYLFATDAALVVPVNTKVKVLVTSVNNMHSWTVPSFGIKMDAVPGIINETWFEVYEEGTYYGQCSEICGIKHYYMPIEVEVVSKEAYAAWIANGGSFDGSVAENNNMTGVQTAAAPK
ncbi:cytochrome c oxidase subunit II [Litorimonas sp. WD9-15]|uniref:cytochrome c oxidase subunit II n=1 Tax=Litorimonas sp. WD9-15 TaxID=3418716 RepID=UPI003D001DE3